MRKLQRFDLRLRAKVQKQGERKGGLRLVTKNISAGGAYFPTKTPLTKGLRVMVELMLRQESATDKDALIQVGGEVLRSGSEGMAIRFDEKYHILPAGQYPV
jgi:hypothetical protein